MCLSHPLPTWGSLFNISMRKCVLWAGIVTLLLMVFIVWEKIRGLGYHYFWLNWIYLDTEVLICHLVSAFARGGLHMKLLWFHGGNGTQRYYLIEWSHFQNLQIQLENRVNLIWFYTNFYFFHIWSAQLPSAFWNILWVGQWPCVCLQSVVSCYITQK